MMSGGPPVRGYEPHRPSIIPSSPAPPALTGTLKLALSGEMAWVLRLVLYLPGGLHFRVVKVSWCGGGGVRAVTLFNSGEFLMRTGAVTS